MFLLKAFSLVLFLISSAIAHQYETDKVSDLIGEWKIDLTPNNDSDNNFAVMTIDEIKGNQFYGEFYRKGVQIQKGQLNRLHGALISSDNSGQYNSSFYLKNGILYGTTHALERGFLSVWTAKRQ